mgnify:CR=1 FL=1
MKKIKHESLEAVHTHTHTSTLNNKNSKGITLVALVVTIVVLLILAGVLINLVLGQNGLISNAKNARNKTLEAEETEGASLNTATDYIKQTAGVSASGITAGDYGKVVTNYNADGKTWEIFYADESNVYLITRQNCGLIKFSDVISNYNGTSDFDGSEEFKNRFPAVQTGWLYKIYTPSNNVIGNLNYSSNHENMKSTEYLLDSTIWNEKYLDNSKAEWAIGGPSMELLVKSYNKYEKTNMNIENPQNSGYEVTISEGLSKDKAFGLYNREFYYWIACPSSKGNGNIRSVNHLNGNIDDLYFSSTRGIRPVVCLKSNVKLKLSEDKTSYSIE